MRIIGIDKHNLWKYIGQLLKFIYWGFAMFRTALLVVLLATTAIASDTPDYQKGTIKKNFVAEAGESAHVYYTLQTEKRTYELKICGSFNDGQSVDFRTKGETVFIRGESGKEIKCPTQLAGLGKPVTYQKGTIEGFERTIGNDTYNLKRQSKVYSLRGPDMIYLVDYCGTFQAGNFSMGQNVEYRVDGERLFILHDNDKEYNCKIEGTHLP